MIKKTNTTYRPNRSLKEPNTFQFSIMIIEHWIM